MPSGRRERAELYQIRNKNDAIVARVRLPRDAFRLGEVINALVDFAVTAQPAFKVRPRPNAGQRSAFRAPPGIIM